MKFVFFLLFLAVQSAIANQNCADLFSDQIYYSSNRRIIFEFSSIYRNNQERFLVRQEKLDLSEKNPKFKGKELTKINNRGEVNSGIYSFFDSFYGPSILKLYRFPQENLIEFKLLENEYLKISKPTLDTVAYIRGNLLSQNFGGPRLYDSGFVKTDLGEFYFFLQLERIFPDIEFFSVKEIAWTHKENKKLVKILRKYPKILEDLEVLTQELMKHQIVPIDPDIAIAKDGRIRWIDTDYWELGTPEQARLAMQDLVDLLKEMRSGSIFSIYL